MFDKRTSFNEVVSKYKENASFHTNAGRMYSLREMQEMFYDIQTDQIELETQYKELTRAYLELDNSKKRYYDLYNFAPVGYLTLSEEGLIIESNTMASSLLGRSRQSLIQMQFFEFIFKEDQDIHSMCKNNFLDKLKKNPCELRIMHSDGRAFWAQIESNIQDFNEVRAYRLIISSIAKRKRLDEELRIAAIAFKSQNGMAITDKNGVIEKVNPAFTVITGYSEEESIGQTMRILKSGRHGPLFYQHIWESIEKDNCWQGEIWNKRKDGQIYPELLTITAVVSSEAGVSHYIASFSDITKNKQAEAEIHRMAYYDHLTSIPNRRLLQDRLSQAIAVKSRSSIYGAMFFVDLDKFKILNDTYGHDIGDLLLIELAKRLKKLVRKSDTVARQGGDEFMILLENLSRDKEEAAILAKQLGEKIFKSMKKPFFLKKHEYYSQMSIGVTLFDAENTVEDLFKQADIALYQAKNLEGNSLCFFDSQMQANLDMNSRLEAQLRKALSEKQLVLYYQPQVDAFNKVLGVEALIRWQHPQRGLLFSDEFVPLAEETGLIVPIGLWVLETACEQLKAWENDSILSKLEIAVNISSRQFCQSEFVSHVQNIIEKYGVNPSLLKLELRESIVLENVKETIKKMQMVESLGVRFSMDNFGTGSSSLSYLARLPLKQLKINKSFVDMISENEENKMIIKTIITMGHGLGMDVIAEGVETMAQQKFLQDNGCRTYQGYLFAKALPVEELENIIIKKV